MVWEQKKDELEGRVTELEETVSDREFQVACLQDQLKSLETFKAETLSNIVKESKDEALLKLQNEIIDLERRLHSRTMDVEMARIDADTQMRWKEEQLQEGVSRQLKLMATEKELRETVSEKDGELRELRQLLDRARSDGGKKEREVTRLTTELGEANKTSSELEKKLEEAVVSHARHLQEMTAQKDTRIAELSKALEELQSEILGSETVAAPERNPLDFATVSTQTDPPPPPPSPSPQEEAKVGEGAAVLQVSNIPDTSLTVTNGLGGSETEEREEEGELTMESHGLIEELQLLRQEQVRLQEEVAEKNKLVRFQQLKIVDMRKALNRELRSQSSVDQFTPPPRLPHTFPAPPSVPFTMTTMLLRGKSPGPAPSGPITSCDDVNIQYLKHVIIKFLCSREDEATQLIRAVATLLNFTTQEEQFVKDYFDYKMSWFGSMPQPIYHPVRNT
ncbi:Golgin subfamily A member 1 [Geodia barretti]|uniref:Golgin subfamily A member 1 n=4 Tax=Geodia barretti TaxID=519541 RepID=A0AA35W7M5_GEOBA|nr:Golgin subfamily A member 1 [Geodia barretti]